MAHSLRYGYVEFKRPTQSKDCGYKFKTKYDSVPWGVGYVENPAIGGSEVVKWNTEDRRARNIVIADNNK